MNTQQVLAAVAVANMESAIQWYERLFGRPFDERPMKEAAEWRLTDGGGVQLVLERERAGKSMVTIGVPDIEALVRDLKSRGIDARATEPGQAGFRLAQIRDPEGNLLTFAQDPRSARSS